MEIDKKLYHKPVVDWRALDQHVLAVAKPGKIGDWAVYIGAVDGVSHTTEWPMVAREGTKLDKRLACFLFPQFDPALFRE